jgi:hypothetical protein
MVAFIVKPAAIGVVNAVLFQLVMPIASIVGKTAGAGGRSISASVS